MHYGSATLTCPAATILASLDPAELDKLVVSLVRVNGENAPRGNGRIDRRVAGRAVVVSGGLIRADGAGRQAARRRMCVNGASAACGIGDAAKLHGLLRLPAFHVFRFCLRPLGAARIVVTRRRG